MGQVVLRWDELSSTIEALRSSGKIIVTTNGVFDVLHIGHARNLQQARQLGDVLVVGINSDACTRTLKGPTRPVVPEIERAEMLAALACVDYVTIFDELTPVAFLEAIKPNIHAKGGDYDVDKMPETEIVKSHGGKVVALPFVQGYSTSDLIQRIRESYIQRASLNSEC